MIDLPAPPKDRSSWMTLQTAMSKYLTMITKVVIKLVLMIIKVWTVDVENRGIEWSENLFNHIMNFSRRSGANGWWWLSISSALQVGKLDLEGVESQYLALFRSGIQPLLPDDFGDEALAGIKFGEEFGNRYGETKFYDPLIWRLGLSKLIIFIFPQVTHILNFSLAAWKTPSVMLATSNPFALILIAPISYPKVFI